MGEETDTGILTVDNPELIAHVRGKVCMKACQKGQLDMEGKDRHEKLSTNDIFHVITGLIVVDNH